MMRITGGVLGGRRLRAPGGAVRPTQDRVREALFSVLAGRIEGSRFLDMFAGSGVVGLEALSRGADRVVWVESDRRVLGVLKRNLAELGVERPELYGVDVRVFLRKRLVPGEFDVIFADPPYSARPGAGTRGGAEQGDGWCRYLLQAIGDGGLLARDGVFVMEHASKDGPELPPGWRMDRDKRYGRSRLSVLVREDDEHDEAGDIRGDI